jgi:transmembrane sensor
MSARAHPSTNADAEAATWLARLHADARDPSDEAAFRRWIDADPANAEAFRHATLVWDAVGAVHIERQPAAAAAPSLMNRRALIAGGGAIVAMGVGLGGWQGAQAGVYQTGLGEQKRVTLEDGSILFLDTDTKLKAEFNDRQRAVTLHHGRANFRVAADAARPFVVHAGAQSVVAPRAVFDVRRDADRVSVMLIEGSVVVQKADGGPTNSIEKLREGERIVIDRTHAGQIDTPDLAQQLAWQNGQMIADNQSLGAMVAEMNRYSPVKLVIADPRAASLKLSGVYRVGENEAFARSIRQLLPVGVRANNGNLEIFSLPSETLMPNVN